ncbi:MAG: ABC transporter permease [Muribaculaceae bacterium]|nr:ABC transporter permease [Bacteroidales bacterium]MDE6040669.1 ABC transporter permease [Muribaculaceae bacterium]
MQSPLQIIIAREYLERVKRKSFIITTLLVPVFMLLVMFAPAAIMLLNSPEDKTVAVIDDTHQIFPMLKNSDEVRFKMFAQSQNIDSLKSDGDIDAILVLGERAIDKPNQSVTLYTHGTLGMMTDQYINDQVEKAIEEVRINNYNIENLRTIMEEVQVNLSYPTIDLNKDEETGSSSTLAYILGLTLDMLLYMFILIYGQMVLNSIIEEKSNRVLELVVSSVKPSVLMMGKIFGVGLVAITQILIWGVICAIASIWALPLIMAMPDVSEDPMLMSAMGQLSDPSYLTSLFVYLLLFFIGGYLFYSSIYAAIGSAVDNLQDASQLSSIATMPVIIGIIASTAVVANPTSTLSFWISIIPFTSPMAMMSRLPYGVPGWEIWLSLALLYAAFMGMIWVAAKIYRVGIFMYGKKPTLGEIIRWARYK